MFSVHTTPEKFENAGFTLWTHQMFLRPHYAGEIWKCNNHRSFWTCVQGKLGKGNHTIIVTSSFRKAPFSKCFSSTRKRKVGVFKFLRFEERFRKASFSWRISVDGRPNRVEIKLRFRVSPAYCGRDLSSSYGVMVWVSAVLKGTIVGEWRFDKLCESRLKSQEKVSVSDKTSVCLYLMYVLCHRRKCFN